VTKEGGRQRIDVALLAAATGQETITVLLARAPAAADAKGLARFDVPKVEVTGANLQRGTLTIRRQRMSVKAGTGGYGSAGLRTIPEGGGTGPTTRAMLQRVATRTP
jgi:hypothetical protein